MHIMPHHAYISLLRFTLIPQSAINHLKSPSTLQINYYYIKMSIDPSSVTFSTEPTPKVNSSDTPVKRGRGRPRKSIVESNASTSPKRKRGRPTKGSDTGEDSLIKKKKTIDVPMEFEGTTFSVDVSEVLTRLDYHTFSKPLRHCFLGIVRDVVEITRSKLKATHLPAQIPMRSDCLYSSFIVGLRVLRGAALKSTIKFDCGPHLIIGRYTLAPSSRRHGEPPTNSLNSLLLK